MSTGCGGDINKKMLEIKILVTTKKWKNVPEMKGVCGREEKRRVHLGEKKKRFFRDRDAQIK